MRSTLYRLWCVLEASMMLGPIACSLAVAGTIAPPASSSSAAPPFPPVWESPIDYFRKLLAADAATRDAMLAAKSEQQRLVLIRSLREYESLDPETAETRLRALDLRACLTPLLRMPLSNRWDRLSLVPERLRSTVAARLEIWDGLSPEIRQLVLENVSVMRLIVSSDHALPPSGPTVSPAVALPSKQLENDISRWQQLPVETRDRVYQQFRRIFDASPPDRHALFGPLNQAELDQIQAAIDKFHRLPKVERDRCLDGFLKFAELPSGERREFLINAAFWERMSPADRQLWRDLVNRFPPYPPGFDRPPLPPPPSVRRRSSFVTTNR